MRYVASTVFSGLVASGLICAIFSPLNLKAQEKATSIEEHTDKTRVAFLIPPNHSRDTFGIETHPLYGLGSSDSRTFADSGDSEPQAKESAKGKAPFLPLYFDLIGVAFIHHSSSGSPPTQNCYGTITITTTGCTEQFSTAGGGGFGMGFRPIRYLQIDPLNLIILSNFNGLGNRTSTFQCVSGCTGTFTASIGTSNGLVTIGARFVLPLMKERLLLSVGGGFAYLRSFEHPNTGNIQSTCGSCQYVSGHGPTEIAEITYFPRTHVGIGLHVRNVQIGSSGLTSEGIFSNSLYGTKYTDQFLLIGGSISFRGHF